MITETNKQYFKHGVIFALKMLLTKKYSIQELENAFMADPDILLDKIYENELEKLNNIIEDGIKK